MANLPETYTVVRSREAGLMAAVSKEAVVDHWDTRPGVGDWESARLGAMFAVHTTLANPFVIALVVLVIAGVLLLGRRRRG